MRQVLIAWVCVLALASRLLAQAHSGIEPVASFVDEQTMAVVHIDTATVDAAAIEKMLLEAITEAGLSPHDQEELTDAIKPPMAELRGRLAQFSKAGGRHLYLVVGAEDLTQLPGILVAPPDAGGQAEILTSALGGRGLQAKVVSGCAVMGTPEQLARLAAIKPAARPDLAAALGATGGQAIQVAIAPSSDARRVFEAVLPRLPAALGGVPIGVFTRGMQWASVGITPAPKIAIQGIIQSPDAGSAGALAEGLGRIVTAVGAMPAIGGKEWASVLRFQAKGNQVVLQVDPAGVLQIVKAMGRPVVVAREHARRLGSANNMRQILQGCMLYMNEHPGEWPDQLETLVKAVGLPRESLRDPRRKEGRPGYLYLRPADPKEVKSETIVLYEDPEGLEEGVNVGYGDGHVGFLKMDAFQEALKKQKGAQH